MSKNKWITIKNPKKGFTMVNTESEIVILCYECIVTSDKPGVVKNKEDCPHAEEYIYE